MGWEMKETCGMFALSCWDAAVMVDEVEHIGECLVGRLEKCYPGHCATWGRELMQTLPSEHPGFHIRNMFVLIGAKVR